MVKYSGPFNDTSSTLDKDSPVNEQSLCLLLKEMPAVDDGHHDIEALVRAIASVDGIDSYVSKLRKVAKACGRLSKRRSQGESAPTSLIDLREEFWALTREGVLARRFAEGGATVRMEPCAPGKGPDLLVTAGGEAAYFEVKRLRMMLSDDAVALERKPWDIATAAYAQLVEGVANVVVVIDRNFLRHEEDIEISINSLAEDCVQRGALAKLSAVLYDPALVSGTDLGSWENWLWRDFPSGSISVPEPVRQLVFATLKPRDIRPTDIGDWLEEGRRKGHYLN